MNSFDWGVIWYSIPYLLQGAVVTLEISALAMVFGTIIGISAGLLSLSDMKLITLLVRAYVYFVRGTPALVQVFLVYFALPEFMFLALGIYTASFIAEIVRSGLQSIDAGQTEAAKAIGMTNRQGILYILLPQSLRRITPPLTNEVITLVKSSSLLSVISIGELTRAAQAIIAAKFTPFELYALLAVFYRVMISALSKLSEYVEARLA